MDEIENRRGVHTGLRVLKALPYGSEPNHHSKIYHDENLVGIRSMHLPRYSKPHDEGKITYIPSTSDYPDKKILSAWFDSKNDKIHRMFIRGRRF